MCWSSRLNECAPTWCRRLRTALTTISTAAGRILHHAHITLPAFDNTDLEPLILVDDQTKRVFVGVHPVSVSYDAAMGVNTAPLHISVLDAETGALQHTTPIPTHTASDHYNDFADMVLDERTGMVFICVSDDDGRVFVHVLDARSGRVRKVTRVAPADAQDPQHVIALTLDAQAKRVIIIQSAQHPSVSLIDAAQGTFMSNTPIDGALPYAVADSERLGRIFVAHWDNVQHEGGPNGPGMVDVLKATTGAILAGVPVGFGPSALTVDDKAKRVVVVDQGGLNQDGSSNEGDITLFDATITE